MDDTRLLSNHGENDEFNKSYSFLMLEMFIETYKHIWKRSRSEMAQLKSMYYRHFSYNTILSNTMYGTTQKYYRHSSFNTVLL